MRRILAIPTNPIYFNALRAEAVSAGAIDVNEVTTANGMMVATYVPDDSSMSQVDWQDLVNEHGSVPDEELVADVLEES